MIALIKIAISLLSDVCGFVVLLFRPSGTLVAENLFLRRQLALYPERGVKLHRVDAATRISLAWLSRLFDWRAALVVVRPETLVRWHRASFRLLWRFKSRVGRPPIPLELRRLIRRLAAENLLWGEERIAIHQPTRAGRAEVATPDANCQCDLRASHRYDSARVRGLTDPALGVASEIDPEKLDGAL